MRFVKKWTTWGSSGRKEAFTSQKNDKDSLTTVYKAINKLSKIDWFKNSVRDIRAFKVEDWSNFTEIVKS